MVQENEYTPKQLVSGRFRHFAEEKDYDLRRWTNGRVDLMDGKMPIVRSSVAVSDPHPDNQGEDYAFHVTDGDEEVEEFVRGIAQEVEEQYNLDVTVYGVE